MFNQSRRKFVKGVAYSSTLVMGGLSSLALARSNESTSKSANQSPIKPSNPDQVIGNEVVTLINHTASSVTFSSISLAGLTDTFQYLAIKENELGSHTNQGVVTIAPGEQLSFVVATLSSDDSVYTNNKNLFITDVLDGHLEIKSEHRQFNGIFPITVFEA